MSESFQLHLRRGLNQRVAQAHSQFGVHLSHAQLAKGLHNLSSPALAPRCALTRISGQMKEELLQKLAKGRTRGECLEVFYAGVSANGSKLLQSLYQLGRGGLSSTNPGEDRI